MMKWWHHSSLIEEIEALNPKDVTQVKFSMHHLAGVVVSFCPLIKGLYVTGAFYSILIQKMFQTYSIYCIQKPIQTPSILILIV